MGMFRRILWRSLRRLRQTAIVDDTTTYTCGKLLGGALFIRRAINATSRSPHVGLLLPTGGAAAASVMATWWARRVAVPLNYLLSADELRYVIEDSEVDTIVTVGPMLDFLNQQHGDKEAPKASRPRCIPDRVNLLRLDELKFTGLPPIALPPRYNPDDLAVILYTSGTSGRPKGVMLTHSNLTSDVFASIEHAGLSKADAFLGVLPQFHSFGLTALTLLPLTLGAPVIYSARFVPRRIVELIRKHRPLVFMALPSMYAALLSVKDATRDDFSSVRLAISGGEPLPASVRDACLDRFGLQLFEGYGLTETAPVTHWATPTRNRPASVGQPLPIVKQLIIDELNKPLPPHQDGEILLAGPNIMRGYFKQPDLTAAAFTTLDGTRYFRTGDIGRVDSEGYLYITGRKKEMLIIGGENVFPREIEEVLNQHPAVKDCAVIGVRDPMRGEVPIAFVEVNDGHDFDADAIRAWCRQSLAQFKVPRDIRKIDALPRNPNGKILRRQLGADA